MADLRIWTVCCGICLTLLSSCGVSSPRGTDSVELANSRLSQRVIDGIGFQRVDADMQTMGDWQGISVSGSLSDGFLIGISETSPDDIYLEVEYDDDLLQFDDASLEPTRITDNLILAVSRREQDTLHLGISRTVDRSRNRRAGIIAELEFSQGTLRQWRRSSAVNLDRTSKVELEVQSSSVDLVELGWEERNTGDYDNNGIINIADVTPIGIYFGERLADSSHPGQLLLVDGDGNGEVNLADLTPIARNFGTGIAGFSLYSLNDQAVDPELLKLHPIAPMLHQDVLANGSLEARKQRLYYELSLGSPGEGLRSYAVRPRDAEGNEGLFSNVVNLDLVPDNLPPEWQGELMVQPGIESIDLLIPQAIDPEGGNVTYTVCLADSGQVLGSPSETCLDLPTEVIVGIPPYRFSPPSLLAGEEYQFSLSAADEQGVSSVTLFTSAHMPAMVPDMIEVWDIVGADMARTASLPFSTLQEPLLVKFTKELQAGDTLRRNEPLHSMQKTTLFANGTMTGRLIRDQQDPTYLPHWDYGNGPFLASLSYGATVTFLTAVDGDDLWLSRYPDQQPSQESLSSSGEPLTLGDLVFIGRQDGSIHLRNFSGGESRSSDPAGSPGLSLCSDGNRIFQLCLDGTLRQFGMPFFDDSLTTTVPAPQEGSSLTHLADGRLVVTLPNGNLIIRTADDLGPLHATDADDGPSDTCVAAVQWTSPPMLVIGEADGLGGRVRAISLDDFSLLWDETFECESLSCSADRIFVRNEVELLLLDLAGRLRQRIALPGNVNSQTALDVDGLAAVHGANLSWLEEAATDVPPVWVGNTGIASLETGDAQMTVSWDHAVDEHGEPVHYVIYYSNEFPPDPDGITAMQMTDIMHTGTSHSYILDGLDNGTRYWFMVRAYDGWWDDNPNLELNLNWLSATPPWHSEVLVLGDDLPAGEVFFMRGLADPAGVLHIVYNDEASTLLTHVFGGTGNWQVEQAGLASWPVNAFDLGWSSDLLIGWANSNLPATGMLVRDGPDSFVNINMTGSIPVANPQVAVDFQTEAGLAFTELAGGVFPDVIDHYWVSVTGGGSFLAPVVVETPVENYGRDLDLRFNPVDDTDPWLAFQRGTEKDPNRLTPVDGTLHFWRKDTGTPTVENVDLGGNPGESDVGKRVQMVLDTSGNPLLAYYDLDSDPALPRGQLKTASWNGLSWDITVLENRDLAFQDNAGKRHTAPELGLATDGSGSLAIAELLRANVSSSNSQPHSVGVRAWIDNGSGFELEILSDLLPTMPSDREPCIAMYDDDGILHVFMAFASEPEGGEDWETDSILHLWRGDPQP